MFYVLQNLHRTRVGGMNIDSVSKYFSVQEAILTVEERNGHPLQGDEILNVDETGLNMVGSCVSFRSVIKV